MGAEEVPALKRGALAFVFRPSRRGRRDAFALALVMFCAVGARSSTAGKSSNHDVTGAFEIAPPTLRNNRFFNKKKPRHHSDIEALGSGRDAGQTISASERDRRSQMFGSFLRSRRSSRSGISPSRIRPHLGRIEPSFLCRLLDRDSDVHGRTQTSVGLPVVAQHWIVSTGLIRHPATP